MIIEFPRPVIENRLAQIKLETDAIRDELQEMEKYAFELATEFMQLSTEGLYLVSIKAAHKPLPFPIYQMEIPYVFRERN